MVDDDSWWLMMKNVGKMMVDDDSWWFSWCFFYDGFYDGAVTVMSWLGKNRGASEWYTTCNMYHH